MPKAGNDTTPKTLKPFVFHGLAFGVIDDVNATAETCPFCDREGKFRVNVQTTECGCFHPDCFTNLNAKTFLKELHAAGDARDIEDLSGDRGIGVGELEAWGVNRGRINGEWTIPAYSPLSGNLFTLYQWRRNPKGKMIVMATAGLEAGMFGVDLFDAGRQRAWCCEGPWDAMALREALRTHKLDDDGEVRATGSEAASLLADANVVGVPGAGVMLDVWADLLKDKDVVLAYDRDDAGIAGVEKACRRLAGKAASVSFVQWPEGLPKGYDVRDAVGGGGDKAGGLRTLLESVTPVPDEWLVPEDGPPREHLEAKDCSRWSDLINAWRKAMKWSGDLEHMLSVCLASVLSTETQGEQLWVLVMAPASSGKTTICEALAVAREYVHSKSVLGRVYSGYKIDKEGSEDFGDVPLIKNKTLVVKEGGTLLSDPNRALILNEYRDLYDGAGRKKYNNGLNFSHEGLRFTMIICGTGAMREMDAAEFGSRYVNCSFSEEDDPEHEREVGLKVVHRAFRNVRVMVNGKPETRADPDMTEAKRLTGGYVIHLRRNAERLMNSVEIEETLADRIASLGEFVAFFRTRQPKLQDEVVEREKPYRLQEQFARLTVCLAAVHGKVVADEAVVDQVRRVAMDTARGRTLNFARHLAEAGEDGVTVAGLVALTGEKQDKVESLLEFLAKIGVAWREKSNARFGTGRWMWRLTDRVRQLHEEVCGA